MNGRMLAAATAGPAMLGLLVGSFAANLLLTATPQGGWVGQPTPEVQQVQSSDTTPTWKRSDAVRFPGCATSEHGPIFENVLPEHVVAVVENGDRRKFTLNRAFDIVEASDRPVLWVVGYCY